MLRRDFHAEAQHDTYGEIVWSLCGSQTSFISGSRMTLTTTCETKAAREYCFASILRSQVCSGVAAGDANFDFVTPSQPMLMPNLRRRYGIAQVTRAKSPAHRALISQERHCARKVGLVSRPNLRAAAWFLSQAAMVRGPPI